MGLSYADLQLKNELTGHVMDVRALVDTGAIQMCIPVSVAVQLGFDPAEVRTAKVTIADGSVRKVPVVHPVLVRFGDRFCSTEAMVIGDEPLMGCIPMEAMDLVISPRDHKLIPNPAHPNFPVLHVK
jgi:clan AA aspartic protease